MVFLALASSSFLAITLSMVPSSITSQRIAVFRDGAIQILLSTARVSSSLIRGEVKTNAVLRPEKRILEKLAINMLFSGISNDRAG